MLGTTGVIIMSFIRTKNIGGNEYFYLVENKREGEKVKQTVLKYLGTTKPDKKELELIIKKEKEETIELLKKSVKKDIKKKLGTTQKEFEDILIKSMLEDPSGKLSAGIVRLPDLKKDIAEKTNLSNDEIDKMLLVAQKNDIIFLEIANDPFSLKKEDKEQGIKSKNGLLFFAQLQEKELGTTKEKVKKLESEMEQILEAREWSKKRRESYKSFIITFGKYKDKSIYEVKKKDIDYIKWLGEYSHDLEVKKAARKVLVGKPILKS